MSGWNRPLNHRWDFDLNGLASALKKHTPVGKGANPGALRRAWRLGGQFGITKNAKGDGVTIRNEKVYARIRDRGGVITAINAPFLHFEVDGNWVRVEKVTQRRTNFIRTAVDEWSGNPRSIKARWGRVGKAA